ncbi:hypothetical protein ZWY2020_000037 [Hordeum vulgare]|nr:hypothetical protein ZWY2020_000037 [Hordeum vulgare]
MGKPGSTKYLPQKAKAKVKQASSASSKKKKVVTKTKPTTSKKKQTLLSMKKPQNKAAFTLRPGEGFGRPSSNGRVKDSWLKVHLELDHMETPPPLSESAKLCPLGDFFRTRDFNQFKNEPL